MTGFFPEFYPDELIFSACSRYNERFMYQSPTCTGRDLFGVERVKVSIDLPSGIGALNSSLPLNHGYTVDRLIYQHTFYPLYSAFIPAGRAAALFDDMTKSVSGAAHGRAGVLTSKLRREFVRFCTECAKEDRAKWGETYWHRIHNVPAVEVCATHQIFLDNSCVPMARRSNHEIFSTAERMIDLKTPRPLNSGHTILVKLASDLEWLLNQPNISSEPDVTLNRYLRLLFENNFATHHGVVRTQKLERAFLEFYSPDLLLALCCELNRKSTWLRRIVQEPRRESTQPVIHHLLLMNFLGCPIDRFFSLPVNRVQPFGAGPWPCLNRVADHFRQPVVRACKTELSGGRIRRPLGTFSCDCGFVYCRLGPDQDQNSRFQFHRIKSYGQVWYSKLKRLRVIERRTIKETASELGVWPDRVRRELKNLKELNEDLKRPMLAPSKKTKKLSTAQLKEFRSEWLLAIKQHPTLSRSKLKSIVGATVYNTLLQNDRKWFEANSPPRVTPPGPTSRTDWSRRDIELAALARTTAAKMIGAPGRPVWASATAIARALGVLEVIHKRTTILLPLTIEAISSVAESVADFALRRTLWVLDCYRKERIRPTTSQLQVRAGVGPKIWKDPKLKETVALAMQSCSVDL